MDWFAFHPYLRELEACRPTSPTRASTTIALADHGKLVRLLGEAFDGTAQGLDAADRLRRVRRPDADPAGEGARLHERQPPSADDAVDEATQARYYRRGDPARRLPARTSMGLLFFHVSRRGRSRPLAVAASTTRTDAEGEPRAGRRGRAEGRCGRGRAALVSEHAGTDRGGQYVAYSFYRVDPAWRRLPVEERAAGKEAFAEVVDDLGRADGRAAGRTRAPASGPTADFFLWKITQRYDDLGELGAALNATPLAGWLETPYSYLATTRPRSTRARGAPRKVMPHEPPYLVVYPFVKVRPWYALPEDGPAAGDGRAHPRSAARSSRGSTTTRPTRSGSTTRSS